MGSHATRSWSAITIPTTAEVAVRFPSPVPEYGLILWWGWDGPMSEEVIVRDLDEIQARGVCCVMIEAGYGMAEPYLSPGWFELVRLAVEHARRRDMRVYLVDEGKYPSGFAGGKFSAQRPDLRMQGLGVAERIPVAPGETLVRSLPPQVVGAFAVSQADQSSQVIGVQGGELRWTAPKGEWEVWLVDRGYRTSVTRAVSNPDRGKDATGPAELDAAVWEPSGELAPGVMAALPRPNVTLDRLCPSVKVLHRRWLDADLFFFFNEGAEEQSFQATLVASGQAQVWVAGTRTIGTLSGVATDTEAMRVSLSLSPYESKFILVGALAESA